MLKMYGIKNCDTIKKAKKWLEHEEQDYTFHDYRVDGIEKDWLSNAVNELGWEKVLNKRGTTYRQLSDDKKQVLETSNGIDVLLENPAMIKRPILESGDKKIIGFKAADWEAFVRD